MDVVLGINDFENNLILVVNVLFLDVKLESVDIFLGLDGVQGMGVLVEVVEITEEVDLFGIGDPLTDDEGDRRWIGEAIGFTIVVDSFRKGGIL
jgi:hypothetical protein